MGTEKFCLKWNDFESNISLAFREIRDEKDFFDVTLACDDDQLQAHKVILSACSPFFRNILKRNPHQHPLLYLKGVKYSDLQSVLNFMYHGEVNVAQDELNSFLAVAEELRVKGLTQNNSGSTKKENSAPKSPPSKSRASESAAPAPKRPRPNPPAPAFIQDDDIQEVVPVKSEPRDIASVPSDPYSNNTAIATSNQHQLQTEEDAYEDNYEDYEGYDQSYDSTMMDPNMTGDGNKGELDKFNEYISRGVDARAVSCNICGKVANDMSNMRKHIENIHFPGTRTYNCRYCGVQFPTRNGMYSHVSKVHRDLK
ncbi:broad-complex core protein isoforms 1/2/3/4/5 isoform X28 [Eurytemora carolleeae]|uniref:broad-complex core protein isoforms 1/2/3/4/5 isoform X28 n=1 Tax=Eurytemora carolleeae TaxID=1294199 RepID=UPI000C76D8B5|nr:broad-complex core protein isoforms 1/2/3/4/5 isoform X28 [Eurytemora carolleeae]|eukprot:XP_023339303.1 broad-complex core protein isoforms 1/2/3/4/5-like isoform X28 [Eurytemora affinis]